MRLPNLRISVGVRAAVVVAFGALCVAIAVTMFTPRGTTHPVAVTTETAVTTAPAHVSTVLVHVTGRVSHPGVYELSEGSRALDAISAAGGYTDDAQRGGVNLARKVADGEQLHVPALGEPPTHPAGSTAGAAGGVVNLNAATGAELETLPGVGPTTAARIIAWREKNGPFRSVDELLGVSGIGEKTLDGLRDAVTV